MSLASLLVDLSVNTAGLRAGLDSARTTVAGFAQSVTKAFDGVEQMGKSIKRAANEVAQAGLGLAAVAGGAVALAATVDKNIAAEVKNLKASFVDLAVPVAQMVVPAMRDFAEAVRTCADFVASLSPETKSMIATFLQVAAVVGGVALVISKVAAAIAALAGVIGAITAGPILALVAGLAAVAAAAVFLHKVWRENWGNVQGVVKDVIAAMAGYWQAFANFVSGVMGKLWRSVVSGIEVVAKAVLAVLEFTGQVGAQQAQAVRDAISAAANLARENGGVLVAEGIKFAEETASTMKNGLIDAIRAMVAEGKIIFKDLKAALGFDDLLKSGAAARHDLGKPADLAPDTAQRFIMGGRDAALDLGLEAKAVGDELANIGAMFAQGGQAAAAEVVVAATTFKNAVIAGAQTVVSKLGDVGQIINSAVQGFTTAGPWGAIIAVLAELLGRLEVFTKFSDMLNAKLFKSLSELNEAIAPLFQMLHQLSEMLNPVRAIIHMVIRFVLDLLGPVFKILGGIFDALGKVLVPIVTALGSLFDAISAIVDALVNMGPVMESIRVTFKIIGAAISFASLGVMRMVSDVLGVIITFAKAVGMNVTDLQKTHADIIVKAGKMVDDLKKFDLFAAPPLGELAKANEKAAESAHAVAEKFSELLHNIPSGYSGLKMQQFLAGMSDTGMRDRNGNPLSSEQWNNSPYAVSGSAAGYQDEGEWGTADPTPGSGGGGGGGRGGTTVVIQNAHFSATNKTELYREMVALAQLDKNQRRRS